MKISEILKRYGLASQDVKSRMKSGQIRLNGEKVEGDPDIEAVSILHPYDFMRDVWHLCGDEPINTLLKIYGFEEMFDQENNCNMKLLFSNFNCIRLSKKDVIIIRKRGSVRPHEKLLS